MKIAVAAVVAAAVIIGFIPLFGGNNDVPRAALPDETAFTASPAPLNAADCLALIDLGGNFIYEHNASKRRGMASTTKIMTALVAIENLNPDDVVKIGKRAVGIEGSSVYLKEGEELSVSDLLYCLLLESGNDAAAAIAIYCGGSIESFVDMMNAKAAELGLKDTLFANPHGLSDESHYTTAHDLALITRAAMEYPLFCEIVSTKRKSAPYLGDENGRILVNHNKMLFNYPGTVGVKTGYTLRDGKCLVSACERDGLTLIAVTLNDPFPQATHKSLYESAFERFAAVRVAEAGEIRVSVPLEDGEEAFAEAANPDDFVITLPKGADYSIELTKITPVQAPVSKGERLAQAKVVVDGNTVGIIDLESLDDQPEHIYSLWEKLLGKRLDK